MKNLQKKLAVIAAVAMAGTMLAGCGDTSSSSSSSGNDAAPAATEAKKDEEKKDDAAPAADAGSDDAAPAASSDGDGASTKLTVLCWNTDDIVPMIENFCATTGHSKDEFNVQNFGCKGGEAAENYDNYLSDTSNDADILFVEADWALKYINDDSADKGTMPLSDIGISESDYANCYGYTVEIGKSTATGVQKGLSWQAAAGGFCYRTDLAEQYLGVTNPDDMQKKVSNWDNFLATAQEVKDASGGETALTCTIGGVWQVFSAARSNPWVVDNKLTLDEGAKQYINIAKTMYDNGYVIKDMGQWGDGWYPAGQTNATMGYFVSTWGFGDAILTQAAGGEGGATYGKWNVCVGPNPFYWGGTWMTVANRCDNKDLAKEFITYFTHDDGAQSYAEFKGEYVSNKVAMDAVIASGAGAAGVLGGQNQNAVLTVVANQINMAGGITPYDSACKDAFNDAVTKYCRGEVASEEECISTFVDNVAAKLPDLDYSNFD